MAKDWYLIKSPYAQFGGTENEPYENGSIIDSFSEMLTLDVAEEVEICNYDLSECKKTRVIVQGNTADTKLKTRNRTMLAPIGTCVAGMYVKYRGKYWIIVGLVENNGMYEKAVLSLCNYLLSWISKKGKIIQRWVSITSASQYNNGETGQQYYFVRSDQLMVVMPDDNDSLLFDTGHRFIIDKRCKVYEQSIDTSVTKTSGFELATYQLTRIDTVLFDYQGSGHSEFMAYQDEQREHDGYYVVDGKGYWLCDQPTNSAFTINKRRVAEIQYTSDVIYLGISQETYTAKFYDEDGNEISESPTWEIVCDFKDKLVIDYTDNSIIISSKDKSIINKRFELVMSAENYASVSVFVTVLPLL